MAKSPRYPRFQNWLLERMVELDYTPMRLALALEMLDGDVESWIAGRTVPTPEQAERLAELFELSVEAVQTAIGQPNAKN